MKHRTYHNRMPRAVNLLAVLALVGAVLIPGSLGAAYAAPSSPFVGHWQATDLDGSDIRLTIGGPPTGPFQITWTDSHMSFCSGEAGIVRGTGQLNEGDANLLEAELHVECFTTGASMDAHLTWRYHPATDTLSARYGNGMVIIWYRPGRLPPAPPALNLRVNYGHDWVESFYEGGHMAWITVTESDGVIVKATAELVTEPKDYWGGETGFQSLDSVWFDADGNPMQNPPNIQPNDWVYGWVDNGASAQVQIGDISGTIDLNSDSIEGTIMASWITDPVQVECLDWGSGGEPPFNNADGGFVLTNGEDPYSCSWAGEWDIQPEQTVGVGYFGPDGHRVANAFRVPQLVLYIHYEYPDVVEGSYELGHSVQVTVLDSGGAAKATATVTTMEMPHWGGAPGFRVEQWDGIEGPPDIQPGDVVRAIVDDGLLTAEARIGEIAATIDLDANRITGTINAPWAGDLVNVLCMPWGGPEGAGEKETTVSPDGISEFTCTWDSTEWDIRPGETVGVAYSGPDYIHSVANAFRVPNSRFTVFPEQEYIEGWEWPLGAVVHLTIDNPGTDASPDYSQDEAVVPTPWDPNNAWVTFNFAGTYDMQPGDVVTLSDGDTTRTHTVQNLAITDVDMVGNTVAGTADTGPVVYAWVHGFGETEMQLTVEDGTWLANFGSIGFDLVEGMCGRSEIRDEIGNSTAVDWCTPNPRLITFPEADNIFGYGWPEGTEVSLTINDQFNQTAIVGPAPWDPNDIMAYFDFRGSYNLKSGDVVTLSGSGMERTHTVRNLSVTNVNAEANTVAGTADTGPVVYAWVHGFGETEMQLTVEDGIWLADFGSISFDLVEGMCGRSEIRDEVGNSTAVDWCIPRPWLNAFPEWDIIYSYEWPANSEVNLTINGQSVQTVTVGPAPWDPNVYTAYFEFTGLYDLKPGDVVTLSGSGMELTYTVQNLGITAVDQDEDTVSGTADANAKIFVWPHATWQQLQVIADGEGYWQVDFTGVFDWVPGECGRSEIRDAFGNSTAVDWCIPLQPTPLIFAHPAYELIEGSGWMPGSTVTITIDDPTNGEGVDYSDTQMTGDDTWLHFWLSGFDLQAGHKITMTDGRYTQTMVVSNLRVTGFNLDAHTVFGVGDPGSEFLVADNGMLVPVNEGGNWSVTFDGLLPGTWWTVIQTYPDGNEVRETFRVPVPVIFAHPAYNFIEGHEWTPGGEVTITIDDPANGEGADYTQTAIASDNINYLYDTRVQFELAFDLQAGHKITMTDGQYTQTMVVSNLRVTGFDLDAHTVFGVGDPGSEAWFLDNGMSVLVDDEGDWSATFDDLLPGTWWTVIQTYLDGNQVVETFRVPE